MKPRLVDYPWRGLDHYREVASNHPQGLIDLSIGSPIDSTPELVQRALAAASDSPGYPKTAGSPELRAAILSWFERRRGVRDLTIDQVLPTIGSKEFISLLPLMLGLGGEDVVVQPKYAYTAYAVGAKLVGSKLVSSDEPSDWPANTRLIWLNSPGNPTGQVHSLEWLRAAVDRAKSLGAVIVNDECYAELPWEQPWREAGVPSILDARVTRGNMSGVLAIYSLSKTANLAGYRLGLAAGDAELISDILNTRMHAGLMLGAPMQAAMTAALGADDYLAPIRTAYFERREILREAFSRAGFQLEASEAGLYLWLTSPMASWDAIAQLAKAGILAAPGEFYSPVATNNLRVALTVPTQLAHAVSDRLSVF